MNISTLNIIQIIIIFSLFVVIILLLRQNTAIKYERRIGKYSIEPVNNKPSSLFDNISFKYNNLIRKLREPISKIYIFRYLSKKYVKYEIYNEDKRAIDYIINKLLIGLIFVILVIFSLVLQNKVISIFEFILYYVIGFYILDIYFIVEQKRKIRKIKEQMLRAIIIMNNAFKSGKSTLQAVYIASEELDEPIKYEFEKMYKEMKYGLSVDTVFERFAKRVNTPEAKYVSSSLTILNKTGGNIVKVFSSIERTLFSQKKLNEELKNLTASSKMMTILLTIIPIIFTGIIYILNPSYFNPLFSSVIGYMIIILIILMLIVYIWVLQRIMKVKV